MGLKKLNKLLDTGYIVCINSKGAICFGNNYQTEVIKVDSNYKVTPKANKTLHAESAINAHTKILETIKNGEFQKAFESEDIYEKLYDVYTTEEGKVVKPCLT